MNEEPHHLTPVGDEALEARIIAWVLGEASPFEAAELENICEQTPEWRVFQRRMLATHELLGEATTRGAAEDWKMPSEKRGKLDALIGAVEVVEEKPQRKPQPWWHRMAGLAAVLAIVAIIGSSVTGKLGKVSKDIVAVHEAKAPSQLKGNLEIIGGSKFEIPLSELDAPVPFPVTPATPVSPDENGYLPARLPNAVGSDERSAAAAGSDDPFAPAEGLASGGEGDERNMQVEGDPFSAPEPQGSVGAASNVDAFATGVASAEVADVPADPFSDGSQPAGAALRYRGAPAKEEATRLAEGDRVPMLDEIPQVGSLFREKPSAPAAPASAKAQAIPGAQSGVAPQEQLMTYAKNLEYGEAGGFLPEEKKARELALSDSSAVSKMQLGAQDYGSVDAFSSGAGGDSSISDDPIRSNPAIVYEEAETVDRVRRTLYKGEGQYNLGKLDDAKREFEGILQIDPDNKAARRWLERVDQSNADYYRSSYDHTRAQLLTDVDKAWELAIPAEKSKEVDPLASELSPASDPSSFAKDADQRSYAWWSGAENQKATITSGAPVIIDGIKATADKDILQEVDEEQTKALKEIQEIDAVLNTPNLRDLSAKKAPLSLPEIFASQEPYSTFSLRVSDNAFRIAQAAMAQNQRPAAESVRVEEFYNAFDYGDPVPTAQEPVAASMEQAAHPILPQRNLLRIGLRTAAAGRGAGQPLHLTLLVDQSGSMSRGDRSDALLASVKELSTLLNAQDQISVIGFSRTPRLLAEKVPGDQHARLIELLARTPSDGGTNLEEALKLGEVVAKRNHLAGAQNRLLLLTDGAANLGNADPDRLAAWVKTLRQQNIAFDIAGIGTDGLNDPLLVEIARNGNGRYYVMNDAKQAKQQFAAQLAGAFRPAAENVKVQVQFNPQRVGKYQLIGFEKDRLRTEDFRNDKVDAAEMAAAEAGQALYQIELLPEGTGDVGEVSVRFRDVATQQMVERKWTIRYDPTTPAFDQATPTMQLAGLAMLSAQKLQGGAAAPMIRFSEMQEPLRNVRDEFSSNKRVGELLEMIQKLND